MGLTRRGQPLHGLPDDFTLSSEDIPDQPEEGSAGKDLPAEVMRVLTIHLDQLDASSGTDVRTAVELIMDTGRRPDEIATLMLDCLETDPDGKPVLIYDNHKEHRKGRRLPIGAATATVITEQQERVRARFPGTNDTELRLIPSSQRNPTGRRNMSVDWIATRHRAWVGSLPEVRVPTAVDNEGRQVTKLLPFSKEKIFPYAYRHTYVICTAFSARGTTESGACRIVPHKYPVLGEARATRPVPGSFSLRCCF
jgi:integrase